MTSSLRVAAARNGSCGAAARQHRARPSAVGLFFVALVLSMCAGQADALSASLYTKIANKVVTAIIQPTPAIAATLVRLSFHDCLGTGGCDGCLNTGIKENAGLSGAVAKLNGFYTNAYGLGALSTKNISRADLWALAGHVAAGYSAGSATATIPLPPGLDYAAATTNFRAGRASCAKSPVGNETASQFPNAHADGAAAVAYLKARFNLTDTLAVALLGAHSLGSAKRANSGFTTCTAQSAPGVCASTGVAASGPWVQQNTRLSNDYMTQQLAPWRQVELPADATKALPKMYVWAQGVPPGVPPPPVRPFSLNSDIGLVKAIAPDAAGKVATPLGQTADAATRPLVAAYAADNGLFLRDFGAAFTKMIETCTGCDTKLAKLA